MADITRDQFTENNLVTRKVFQKGRYVADADLNEQAQIFQNYDRRLLSSLVNFVDKRFGDGFKVVEHNNSLTVSIKAGYAAFHLTDKSAVLLKLDNDLLLSGFSVWTQLRTDYVYIDIEEKEITPADDIVIVNPLIGEETCRDIRLSYEIKISEGIIPGTPPSGHIYRTIAAVTKTVGSYIANSHISSILPNFHIDLPTLPEMLIWSQDSVSHVSGHAKSLQHPDNIYFIESITDEAWYAIIRFAYVLQPAMKYIALRAKVYRETHATMGSITVYTQSANSSEVWIPKTNTEIVVYCPTPVNITAGTRVEIVVAMKVGGINAKAYMEAPAITIGFGEYEQPTYSD